MAGRLSVDDKLAALRALRGQALSADDRAALKKSLADRSNLVVAAAAPLVADNGLVELARELEAAFGRFLVDPIKDDKLCRAKLAVVQALDKLEHEDSAVFCKAAEHVQLEPVWGRSEDSAGPLRAAALIALVRVEGSSALTRFVDALTDPEKDVRAAAAVALGAVGGQAAGLVLRLKAHLGDRDPDVLSECLSGLLAVDHAEYLPFVAGFLDPDDSARCEAAALALGKSRRPEALEPLAACWRRCGSDEPGAQVLLAIAMLRVPGAMEFLLGLVASGSEKEAVAALSALKMYNYDARLCERLAEVVRKTGNYALQTRFDRDFRADDR